MSSFNPGNSSLQSATREDAFLESLQLYRKNLNDDALADIEFTVAENLTQLRVNAIIPIVSTPSATGTLAIEPVEESSFSWQSDPTSDATASTLIGQFFLITNQLNTSAGNNQEEGVGDPMQLQINTDNGTATIAARITLEDTDEPYGGLAFSAKEFT
ncbi:MAG: hypothetical protein ACFB9N_05105 [Geitlerinemataceae cyanobacterium]